MEVERDLRRALDGDQLRLHFQPVVWLTRDEIVGFEALVRWQHPARGLLEPADFMPVAESSGLVVELGEWVLRRACAQASRWAAARPGGKALGVSVNVSARHFARSNVVAAVSDALRASALDPRLLAVEITERTLLEDRETSLSALRELRALGVRIALDDFGTGYSSLSNLRHFTIDTLKIDRSFIEAMEAGQDGEGAIVSAVLGMARALGIGVTAEGVESCAQVVALRERGCEYAQGYLFSRPVPEDELVDMLSPRASGGDQLLRLLGGLAGAR
jgi:EAL domain-containing protein (putative c-di-GMP-specific phosphodiesterase class I)